MVTRLLTLLVSFTLLLFSFPNPALADGDGEVTFAVYGDIPYNVTMLDGRTDGQILMEDIAPEIRRRDDLPFVIHVGDLSRPDNACSDTWLEKTKEFWDKEVVKPIFYTPGDNDWTDCDRPSVPEPTSEVERLEAVRRVFFSEEKNLPKEWKYKTQDKLPENAMWWDEDVLFVTQHFVSTENGRTEILLDDPVDVIPLVDQRDRLNHKWLNRAFKKAKKKDAAAVVVATQLDPFGPPQGSETPMDRCMGNLAYQGFCAHLQNLASEFDKPVLLIHGDTNAYCLDQPFDNQRAPYLWRLNGPGDYQVIDAVVISVHGDNKEHPFQVTGLLSGEAPPQVCDYSY